MDLPKALNAMSKDGLRVLAKSIGGLHPPSEKKNLIQYVITRIVVQLPPPTTHNEHANTLIHPNNKPPELNEHLHSVSTRSCWRTPTRSFANC